MNRREKIEEYEGEVMTQFGLGLVAIQGFLVLLCLGGFSLCIWIRFDLDFWEWVVEIGWYTYWNCMYVVMVGLLFKIVLLGAGAWLTANSRAEWMVALSILHLPCFALHVAGTVLIIMHGVEDSTYLKDELHDILLGLVYQWDIDPRKARILKIIQEYVGCCGATGGGDFLDVYKEIPSECRHPVTGNEWDDGCEQAMAWWLEPWTATLAGMSIFMAVCDVFLIYSYNRLRRYLSGKL